MKSIKVTSPLLNNLIFFGCYIYLISILFLSFKGTTGSSNPVALTAKCSDFIWCETIGFSLITGRKVEFPDMPFISEIANFLIQGGIG